MSIKSRNKTRLHRKNRIRAKISGSKNVPRISVFRSLRNINVQAIDDTAGETLFSASLADSKGSSNTIKGAFDLGKLVAKKCKDSKVEKIVFDRSGYSYHGKVKAVADGMREGGVKF